MAILVTGAAGYIGSHACVALLQAGREVIAVDNLSNSSRAAVTSIANIAGRSLRLIVADITDEEAMAKIFREHSVAAVIHFAGLKAVGESVMCPLDYYRNNVGGTLSLLKRMQEHGVGTLIFSSSATVYGDPSAVPVTEDFPLQATNAYGRTKLMIEEILHDLVVADRAAGTAFWDIAILRYFNPVGAHPSGALGEDPLGIPNNLVPFIARVAVGQAQQLSVYGNDYPTRDGTGVRDYIHVMDLVDGHIKALDHLLADRSGRCQVWNLGAGRGYSVLEVIAAFEAASGRVIPYRIAPRRAGDIAECWSDPTRAREQLGWVAQRSLEDMMADTWRWQSAHPQGFRD